MGKFTRHSRETALRIAGLLFFCVNHLFAQTGPEGIFFAKKTYEPFPLPRFGLLRDRLPSPVYEEDPLLVETYWKAWELAFRNFHEPAPGSGFVSQFIDAAFNKNIFLWDTAFMTMFCSVAHDLVPGVSSLDNFYIKQHATGEICREIDRTTGIDFQPWINASGSSLYSAWGFNTGEQRVSIPYIGRTPPEVPPALTLDALDNPIPAWAELESYRYTGDTARLRLVRDALVHYYLALRTYLQQGNGLYVTDWASMDNSPRNPFLCSGGQGVDISSQMVLFARNLGSIDRILGNTVSARVWTLQADSLSERINRAMWDEQRNFYYDLTPEGHRIPVKTVAAFWTLLSGVARAHQAKALEAELRNPATFSRVHPVPSCAANEPAFSSHGGYWRGAVWPSTNTMVIRGLEQYGYTELAREIALTHLRHVAAVYKETGTIWENYAPDAVAPGRHVDGALVLRDMVGWSGIGPILYLLEYAVGLQPSSADNTLHWAIRSTGRCGCARYRFNGHVVSLVATPSSDGRRVHISVDADGAFTLHVKVRDLEKSYRLSRGVTTLDLGPF